MERIFFIKNGNLTEINNILKKGGSIKMVQPVSEVVSTSCGGESEEDLDFSGDVYAYIVVKMP